MAAGGGARSRTLSPGLAGLVWVRSVAGWQSAPEGRRLGAGWGPGAKEPLGRRFLVALLGLSRSQLQGGNVKAGCDYQERDGVFSLPFLSFISVFPFFPLPFPCLLRSPQGWPPIASWVG